MDSPRRSHGASVNAGNGGVRGRRGPEHPRDMVIQSDFRKVSGISSEIFEQIQAVENDHDATTAASLAAVEKKGEMLVRILDPRSIAQEESRRFLSGPQDPKYMIQFIEIVKRPGQTLGLYLREGNCMDRPDGVFVSRIALESAVYDSGVLRVSDEILAVNLVDVTKMSLDDVVIIMSIPRRLVLTLRTGRSRDGPAPSMKSYEPKGPPVVIVKKRDLIEEEDNSSSENGRMVNQRVKHYEGAQHDRIRKNGETETDQCLFYNSQPKPKFKQRPLPPPPLPRPLCQKTSPRSQTLPPPCGHVHSSKSSGTSTWRPPTEPKPSYYYSNLKEQSHSKESHHKKPVVTDQPKAQLTSSSFPKTLESLAEKVHTFYSGPRLLDTRGQPIPGSIHASSSEKCLNLIPKLDRSSGTMPRNKDKFMYGRLLRVGSEQRIPTSYSQTLKASASMQYNDRVRSRRYDTIHRMGSGAMKAKSTPCESFSDTEASTGPPRPSILTRQRSSIERGSTGRYTSLTRSQSQLQSNSLPRMRSSDYDYKSRGRGGRHKYSVRFERDTHTLNDSQDESDGAVSAPEMPSFKDRRQKGKLFIN